jgi:hypothetical protein
MSICLWYVGFMSGSRTILDEHAWYSCCCFFVTKVMTIWAYMGVFGRGTKKQYTAAVLVHTGAWVAWIAAPVSLIAGGKMQAA